MRRRHAANGAGLVATAGTVADDRVNSLPIWVRAPRRGVEFYTGFSRPKLYLMAAAGQIRSVSIRQPGALKGVRLFNLPSILEFIERCERAAARPAPPVHEPPKAIL